MIDEKNPLGVRFLHFNDVYHITPVNESSKIPGGAARFVTAVQEYQNNNNNNNINNKNEPELITFFGGDIFNPSLESSLTKGWHMIPILNKINVNVAVYGNHDFDFGVPELLKLKNNTNFPWLIANVYDSTGKPVAEGEETTTFTVNSSDNRKIKIGVVGLIEKDWLDTIRLLPPDLKYIPFEESGLHWANILRNEQKCDIVIALTHMREPNNIKLVNSVPKGTFDLVLSGHDHFYHHIKENGVDILCSGTDFRNLTYIEGRIQNDNKDNENQKLKFIWNFTRKDIDSSIKENEDVKTMCKDLDKQLNEELDKIIGWTDVSLDTRFSSIRSHETEFGNFTCDLIRTWYNADICLVAGGTFRLDSIIDKGPIALRDMALCFPFDDPLVVLNLQGKDILLALENSVSKLPALEGRFAQVSGIYFTFSLNTSPRVHKESVRIGNNKNDSQPIELEKYYSVATRSYMATGKDGYTSLVDKPFIVDDENGMMFLQLLNMWFLSLQVANKWKNASSHLKKCTSSWVEDCGNCCFWTPPENLKSNSNSKSILNDTEKTECDLTQKSNSTVINTNNQTSLDNQAPDPPLRILRRESQQTRMELAVIAMLSNGVSVSNDTVLNSTPIHPIVEGRIIQD